MKKVDSQALGILNQALGLTGAGSPVTELTDGIVDQTLDVVPVVRRSRTQAATDGIYTAVFQNVHAGSGALSSQINPYNVGFDVEFPPYPVPTPRQFDIWVLGATARRLSGAGTVAGALIARYSQSSQAWGITDTNTQIALLSIVPLAFWDSPFSTGSSFFLRTPPGDPSDLGAGFRLPRDVNLTLIFETNASDISNYVCDVVLGVFPIALGQDGRV